jgi:predicted Zn-dependent peptidase
MNEKFTFFNINGFEVLYIKYPNLKKIDESVSHIQAYVKAGNFVEDKNNAGISHLLEHILLDSWYKCKGNCNDYFKQYGVDINGFTDSTLVSYLITGLSQYEDDYIDFISSILTKPKWTEKIIKKSKKAVQEELLSVKNNPEHKLEELSLYKIYDDPIKYNGKAH